VGRPPVFSLGTSSSLLPACFLSFWRFGPEDIGASAVRGLLFRVPRPVFFLRLQGDRPFFFLPAPCFLWPNRFQVEAFFSWAGRRPGVFFFFLGALPFPSRWDSLFRSAVLVSGLWRPWAALPFFFGDTPQQTPPRVGRSKGRSRPSSDPSFFPPFLPQLQLGVICPNPNGFPPISSRPSFGS